MNRIVGVIKTVEDRSNFCVVKCIIGGELEEYISVINWRANICK